MTWWLLRQHRAFWPVVGVVAAFLGLVLGLWWSSLPQEWSKDEISKVIPQEMGSGFKVYRNSDLKRLSLQASDFTTPLEIISNHALDPRLEPGLADQYSVKTLYANGVMVEWDFEVRVSSVEGQTQTFVQKGHVRRHGAEWQDFHQVQVCQPKTETLSSGVVTRSADCNWTSTTRPLGKLGVDESFCQVVPSSFRGRKMDTKMGTYQIKRVGRFAKSSKETTVLDGDLICDGKRRGFGQERVTVVFTNAEPSLLSPGAGSRKVLSSLRTVFNQSGEIVFQARQDLTRSIRPEPLNRPSTKVAKKRLARR